MEKEPTIAELLNQIKLMELALNFYANDNNYIDSSIGKSPVAKDGGHQARFALSQIKKISDYETSLLEEVNRISKELSDQVGDEKMTKEEILSQFNKLKQELNNKTNEL